MIFLNCLVTNKQKQRKHMHAAQSKTNSELWPGAFSLKEDLFKPERRSAAMKVKVDGWSNRAAMPPYEPPAWAEIMEELWRPRGRAPPSSELSWCCNRELRPCVGRGSVVSSPVVLTSPSPLLLAMLRPAWGVFFYFLVWCVLCWFVFRKASSKSSLADKNREAKQPKIWKKYDAQNTTYSLQQDEHAASIDGGNDANFWVYSPVIGFDVLVLL